MPRSPGGRGSMVGGGGESGGYTGETHLPMEIARLLISLLHAWGLDPDLDKVCESKLGLLRPLRPVCFGQISKGGYMSLLLPTYLSTLDDQQKQQKPNTTTKSERHVKIVSALPTELQLEEEMARRFTSRLHWELSTALTTNHLLSLISMAHTMMSMGGGAVGAGSFASDSNRRKLIRKLSRQGSTTTSSGASIQGGQLSLEDAAEMRRRAEQAKESWNLFASLHCRILPDLLARSSAEFKRPLVEILARRWQDRCIEIRMAAQSLLLAELKLAGSKGRRAIVEEWSPFLPTYTDNQMDHGRDGVVVVVVITREVTTGRSLEP
ncbi:WD repeat-containing protein 7 [Tyrophagus putrescentiae]|nr:WD repeat-containing protein 7 [Tyrophagus putrescentiae]